MSVPKAASGDFPGRFREVISDPLNLCIHRVHDAGTVSDGLVTVHNGHRVPLRGPGSYYGGFSDIMIYNRGVHEPLEELIFQEVLKTLPDAPVMVELGAYWAHYSMWFKQKYPKGRAIMVEPGDDQRHAGEANFERHGYEGTFIAAMVGTAGLAVDTLFEEQGIEHLSILHSDIQGAETEMLKGARASLAAHRIDNVFISTHSQNLHSICQRMLADQGYNVEVSADWANETTSYDGFMFARRNSLPSLFKDFRPLGRAAITGATPAELLASIRTMIPEPKVEVASAKPEAPVKRPRSTKPKTQN